MTAKCTCRIEYELYNREFPWPGSYVQSRRPVIQKCALSNEIGRAEYNGGISLEVLNQLRSAISKANGGIDEPTEIK